MATALEELIQLLPPPKFPVDAVGDWERVEAQLGTALPRVDGSSDLSLQALTINSRQERAPAF
jgi:hypothetical protein